MGKAIRLLRPKNTAFILNRRHVIHVIAEAVLTPLVVGHLNEVKDALPSLVTASIDAATNRLPL